MTLPLLNPVPARELMNSLMPILPLLIAASLGSDRVWVQKSAQAEVVMRQELEDGVNFISAAHRLRARFGPQTTRRRQIQPLDTARFSVGL